MEITQAGKKLQLTMDTIAQRKLKVVINGGALNRKGLATKCFQLVRILLSLHS